MKFDSINIQEFERQIDKVQNICLISHLNPDGDAIGSLLSMSIALKNAGKDVYPVVPNDFAEFLKWMPSCDTLHRYDREKNRIEAKLKNADLIICLDFNQLDRTGKMASFLESLDNDFMLIDHHPYPGDFAKYKYSTVEACAASEIIFDLLWHSKYKKYIDDDVAACLLTAIMTDTEAANLAGYYAGICYLNLNKYQASIDALSNFETKDNIMLALKNSMLGDAYIELNKNDKALEHYNLAIEYSKGLYIGASILMKVGKINEALGNYKEAHELYLQIQDNYGPYSNFKGQYPYEANPAFLNKYITRAKQLIEEKK
jgi:nanoRNase/pAp phosphatase (c-di-AMP/oligoRNAs hydrolase)